MNKFYRIKILLLAYIFALAGIFISPVHAQQRYENRMLFVFDTAWAMKARLPKTQSAMSQLLITLMQRNELRNGDTIGVWTFCDDVSQGKFPLQIWDANSGGTIASNINRFVIEQKYKGSTRFDHLMLAIPTLVQNSDRLTIVVFCDGDGEISGTPFDAPINGLFKQKSKEARKEDQPFLVIIRSQLGRYAGCRVNVPPEMEIPFFPTFPAPPVPLFTPPTNSAPRVSGPVQPPLLIVGKNVYTGAAALTNHPLPQVVKTNPPEPVAPTNVPAILKTNIVMITNYVSEVTNAPMIVPIIPPTNTVTVVATNLLPAHTNPTALPIKLLAKANAVAAKSKASADKKFAIVGAGFLVAAIGLGIFLLQRSRRKNSSSLITRSMNKK